MVRWFAAAVLFGFALPAGAVGTLVPASNRVDAVHDDARNIVYITNAGQVLRYHEPTGAFLAPVTLGGQLGGVDISPDNRTLVVADRSGSTTHSWVHLVDLETLAHETVSVATPNTYEGGTFTAVYAANGLIYTTSTFLGSGWVPLRRLDPATRTWTDIASVRQDTMLSASGDGLTIAFAESNTSGGDWGLVDVPTGGIVRNRYGSPTGPGTEHFNWEIGTDRWGARFAVPTYFGTYMYDDTYQQVGTIGTYAGQQPVGVAYHPVEPIVYFPFADTTRVRAYDSLSLAPAGEFDFQHTFTHTGNHAFQNGRMRLSRDGSLMLVTVAGGVRIHRQYPALRADPVTITTNVGQTAYVVPPVSIGNFGSVRMDVATAPAHGTAGIFNYTAVYDPAPGFVGTDSFTYEVTYGRARRTATITVNVVDPNRAPVAVNDSAFARNTAILIPVLANDSDPDGDALALVAVGTPNAGAVAIQGNQVRFTPPKKWPAAVSFTYTVRDTGGKQATATVTVRRN